MIFDNNTLYTRIFLPFCAAVVVATGVAWATATYLISDALESDLAGQLENARKVVADEAFPLTRDLLVRLARLQQAELVLFGSENEIVLSTLDLGEAERMKIREVWMAGESNRFRLDLNGEAHIVLTQALPSRRELQSCLSVGNQMPLAPEEIIVETGMVLKPLQRRHSQKRIFLRIN